MEFMCSVCEYKCDRRLPVETHIKKKKSCGPGVKTVVEVPKIIRCNICNKNLAVQASLDRHMIKCKEKIQINEVMAKMAATDDNMKILQDQVAYLTEKLAISESEKSNAKTINNYTVNTTNTAIIINNYDQTPRLSNEKINNIIITADNSVYILIDYLREKYCTRQENMCLCISNRSKSNNLMNKRINGKWNIVNKRDEILNVISDNETELDDWVNDNKKEYPRAARAYQGYVDVKYEDNTQKEIRDNLELMLCNVRRSVIKN